MPRSKALPIELTLVGRVWCHLCDDMADALSRSLLLAEYDASLRRLDADRDPGLERYDELVPVLLLNGEEVCHYFLDEEKLKVALEKLNPRGL